MFERAGIRKTLMRGAMALGLVTAGPGCLDRPVAAPTPDLQSGISLPVANNSINSVDILFEIDNSNSMEPNQAQLAQQFSVLIDQLVAPPLDPTTHLAAYPPVASMHVGVISQDLGTPGSQVPSCANSDLGDNGVLNPIRNGLSVQQHEPWTSAPAGIRPTQCMNNPNQYPNFLTFDATMIQAGSTAYQTGFANDFVCNAFLSIDGCGLEAQLESVYRALVIHNPRAVAGNMDVNAGFVRDDAVLAIVIVSDEEDGSVRDCRFAELNAQGQPLACNDAITVYDESNPNWSSNDLNLRFYMYTPLGPQDPTWTLDRYIDPTNTNRGFLSLKPGHPDQVIFAAITGIPLPADMPTQPNGDPNWTALLGSNPNGSDGLVGTAVGGEGPFSMKQANPDPNCPSNTVPACRRQGSTYNPAMAASECVATTTYFAWPSRRIVKVAELFEENYQNGTVSSICASDYSSALAEIVTRIQNRFTGRCFPRPLQTTPANPTTYSSASSPGTPVTVNCTVTETLPTGTTAAQIAAWCGTSTTVPSAHGRTLGPVVNGQQTCIVSQVAQHYGDPTVPSGHGFYYDTSMNSSSGTACAQAISFTTNDTVYEGGTAQIDCVEANSVADGGT